MTQGGNQLKNYEEQSNSDIIGTHGTKYVSRNLFRKKYRSWKYLCILCGKNEGKYNSYLCKLAKGWTKTARMNGVPGFYRDAFPFHTIFTHYVTELVSCDEKFPIKEERPNRTANAKNCNS